MNMFDKHYKECKTHLKNARKQESDGHLKEAIGSYQKAIEGFKAHGSSLFHDVKRHLAEAYLECGDVYKSLGEINNANTCYKEAQKYGPKYSEALIKFPTSTKPLQTEDIPIKNSSIGISVSSTSLIEIRTPTFLPKLEFFIQDPLVTSSLQSKINDINNISSTQDLAYYLQPNNHTQEQAPQLIKLAQDIVQLFAQKKPKTQKIINEVVILASIPNEEIYKDLLEISINEIKNSTLQHSKHLFCLTQVIQNMPNLIVGKVSTGSLVAILKILHNHLEELHKQDNEVELSEFLQTLCPLLDAMVRIGIKGINRERLHAPLYQQLKELKDNPALAYHAHYACQGLLYITSDEKLWQEVMRRTFKIASGTISLVNAVRSLDPNKLLDTFKNFSEAFEAFDEIVSRIRELVETEQTLKGGIEEISQGGKFEQTRHWYLALRFIDIFIHENQLNKLEQFVLQSPYTKNKWFLIGLCQRLGQLACTHWDLKIQQVAIEFLDDLYQNKIQWGQHPEVKNYAKAIINNVASGKDASNSSLYGKSELLIEASLKSSQNLVSNIFEPLAQLGKIRKEYLDELEQDEEIKNALGLYVPQKGKWALNATNSFDLKTEVDAFLTSEKKVLLLLGEAGAGKSTFNRHLAQSLWNDYSSEEELDNKIVPLFISLPTIDNPNEKIIQKYLKELRFSEETIENLRQNCKFVFILDGYDEIKDRQSNFYDKNKLHEWKKAKVIISCRPEYLSTNYKSKFIPRGNSNSFQEIWLASFSKEEIREYTRKYVEKQRDNIWDAQKYEAVLKRVPDSDQLLSNPFILKIAIQVIPDLENENSAKNITRLILYNEFVEKWFQRSQDRLSRIQLDDEEKKAFKILDENDFAKHCMLFNKDLAVKMFKTKEVVVMYSDADNAKTHTDWRAKFFGYRDPETRLLRYNSPLSRNGDQYRFIHKSLFEYFVARSIFDDICKKTRSTLFEEISILGDPEVVRFLTEYAQNDRGSKDSQRINDFKENLSDFIEKSKEDTHLEIAAANAITILNKAGMSFSGKNLNGIHIAGANLSYGLFHCTQFKQADLINVNFKGAWLHYADFSDANMTGVQFGEFPFLDLENESYCCCYSPDNRFLAVASGKKIYLYNIETLEKIHTFEGHADVVWSVTFSPDGTQLASGSSDKTVRLWSIKNINLNPRIIGHTDVVWSVTFSPDGTQLASGSNDKTVRLWSIKNLDQNPRILEGHTDVVWSVTFSPDGSQLASCSLDKTVRLWFIENLDQNPRIIEHTDRVWSVAFSPDGTQLASGSSDKMVRLWSIENLDLNPRILKGHSDRVWSVKFSSDGTQLASCSSDQTVRLWSIEDLVLNPRILEGHISGVNSVSFSPDDTQLASCSSDKTVRMWSAENLYLNPCSIEGHTERVWNVTFSPDGTQLASGSSDKTVRLWSIENLNLNPRILGHTDRVWGVAFSPDGTQLASGSDDKTVRLWSIENLDLNPRILEGHTDRIWSVTFSPDGTQLASGSSDKTVRLWSIDNLDLNPCILEGHSDRVWSVTFSPDGAQLASGSSDKTVRLWSIENLNLNPRIIEGHTDYIRSLTFSPDGTQLASGSSDKTVRLWSIENPDLNSHILEGHTSYVSGVTFSPDGTQLASGSDDKTVRLWSTTSGSCLVTIYLPGIVNSVDWKNTKAGNLLLTGGSDKVIRLWLVKRIDDQTSQVALHWTSSQNMLWISKAYIQNVKGLDLMNVHLLKQRGANVESEGYFNENDQA